MGPGHLGIGFAAKSVTPEVPLWVLLVSSEALDLLSFGFGAIGIEKFGVIGTDLRNGLEFIEPGSVPWSHGLFMSVVWSVVFALIAYYIYRDRRASGIIGLVVFSHWVLDFIVHPPDLPLLFNGSPLLGLGLWTSGPGLIISGLLELVLLIVGIEIYRGYRKRTVVRERE